MTKIGLPILLALAVMLLPVLAEDWTVDGKDYHNVTVTKVEPDAVHIMFDGGIGSVKLSDLTPDLQKRFNYDPEAAQEASKQKAAAQAQADAEMQAKIGVYQFDDFLDNNSYAVHIQVSQIGTGNGLVSGGAFVDVSITMQKDEAVRVRDWGVGNSTKMEHRTVTEELKMPQKVWVIGLPDSLVDGDTWDGVIYLLGRYSPTMVSGAASTVRMFAASKEAAYAYCKDQNQTGLPVSTSVNAPATATDVHTDAAEGRVPNQPKASGSGAFISVDGLVLTAAHVVRGAARIEVVAVTGKFAATVVKIDTTNDVALLKCAGSNYTPLPIAPSKEARAGKSVFTVGFPNIQIQGFDPKLTKGEISSQTGFQDDPRDWQISVPIQPGNSGGPLCDENGNLIGIILATLDPLKMAKLAGEIPQNVNYAVKSSYILPLLDDVQNLPKPRGSSPGKFEDVVDSVRPSTVLILVY